MDRKNCIGWIFCRYGN